MHSTKRVARLFFPLLLLSGSPLLAQFGGLPAQSTTGPIPPATVNPKTTNPLAAPTKIISAVPAYSWRHGCGPTALGMVIGYFDGHGFPTLFTGAANLQTGAVNQHIASQGSGTTNSGKQLHYEDFSLPKDSSGPMQPDRSQNYPAGCHRNDCIGDFMQTSWSAKGNRYGWSWSNRIAPAFKSFCDLADPLLLPTAREYRMAYLSWARVKGEIDRDRPMVFLVDSSGNGSTDHFVTIVGYNETPTQRLYGCLDTWAPHNVIRWCEFRAMSNQYRWGIWGGWTFDLKIRSQSRLFLDQTAPNLPLTTGATNDLLLEDLDGDGDQDLVVVNYNPSSTQESSRLFRNDGTGHFRLTTGRLPTGGGHSCLAHGDIDGDQDTDLILASRDPNQPGRLLRNNSKAIFADQTTGNLPHFSANTSAILLVDIDGDKDLDLVEGNDGTQNRLLRNNGTGSFTVVTTGNIPLVNDPTRALAAGDIDGDGDQDLLIGNRLTAPIQLLVNDGMGKFTLAPTTQFPALKVPTLALALADIDGDGDLDLLIGTGENPTANENLLFRNNGKGTFTDLTAECLPPISAHTRAIQLGDLDGDGDLDLLTGNNGYQQNRIYLNAGQGRFTDISGFALPPLIANTQALILGDVDGDGDLDLFTGNGKPGASGEQNRLLLNLTRQLHMVTPLQINRTLTVDCYSRPAQSTSGLLTLPFLSHKRLDLTTPYGLLGLDPRAMVGLTPKVTTPATGRASFNLPVPNTPLLIGAEFHFQALVQAWTPTDTTWRFTNRATEKFGP